MDSLEELASGDSSFQRLSSVFGTNLAPVRRERKARILVLGQAAGLPCATLPARRTRCPSRTAVLPSLAMTVSRPIGDKVAPRAGVRVRFCECLRALRVIGTLARGRMRCHGCGSVVTGAPEVCPRCRTPLDENRRTLAWSAADVGHAQFDAELVAARRIRRLVVVAVVGGVFALSAVAVAAVLLWSRRGAPQPTSPAAPVTSAAADASHLARAAVTERPGPAAPPAPPAEQWWTPPPSSARQRVEVLAYGFSGIDERDLGAAFTADLQPITGAPHVFEERAARHARRNEIDKHLLRLWDGSSLDAGIRFLFVGFGSASRTDHDHTVFHSREVEETVSLDESAHMRQPPPSAVFYLSAVHLGSCVDFVIDGDYAETGKRLSLMFGAGSASLQNIHTAGSYEVNVRGLGVRDIQRDGIWAMTIDDIARSYRAERAPIELVFTTIPGRVYRPAPVSTPIAVLDEPLLTMKDGEYTTWTIPQAGRYRFVGRSRPYGLGVLWSEGVECNVATRPTGEYKSLDMTCVVPGKAVFQVSNPTTLGWGPPETMSIYLAKLP